MGCSAFPPPRRPPRDSAVAAGSSASDAWTLLVEQTAQIKPKVPLWRPLVSVSPAPPHDVAPDGATAGAPAAPWSALSEQSAAAHAALPADFAALGATPLEASADVAVPAAPPAHDPVENEPASAPEVVGMSEPAIPARIVTDSVLVTEHGPLPAPVAADSVIRATGTATLGVPPTSVAFMGFAGELLAENTALPALDWSAVSGGTRVVRATAAATTTSALGGGFIVAGVYVPWWTITVLVCVLWIYWVLLVAKVGKKLLHKLLCIDVFHGMFVMARRKVCGSRLTKARDKAKKAKKAKKEKKKEKKEKKERKKARKAREAEFGDGVDMGQYAMAGSMRAIPSAANVDAYLATQASMMRAPAALSSSALAMGMTVPGAGMMPEMAQAMMLTQQQGKTIPHNYTDLLAQSLEIGGTLSAGSSPRTGRRQQGGSKILRKGTSSVV